MERRTLVVIAKAEEEHGRGTVERIRTLAMLSSNIAIRRAACVV